LTTLTQIDLIPEFQSRHNKIKKITKKRRSMSKDLRSKIERSTKTNERQQLMTSFQLINPKS